MIDLKEKLDFYQNKGFNCSEALLRVFVDEGIVKVSPDVFRISQVFNGAGKAGKQCGYVNAGLMIIGLLFGRESSDVSREPAETLAREFAEEFESAFGSCVCRKLRPEGFGLKKEDNMKANKRCKNMGKKSIEILLKYIEKGRKNIEKQ